MWKKVSGKPNPQYGTQLLVAWKPATPAASWMYDVLTHWPDGIWTDDADDVVEQDEMPDYWMAISAPDAVDA